MKKLNLLIPLVLLAFLYSCGNRVYRSNLIIPSPEPTGHNIVVKTFKTDNFNNMHISLKNAQVTFTNWRRKEVKVEIETIDQSNPKSLNTQKVKPEDTVQLDFKGDSITIKEPIKNKYNVLNKIIVYGPSDVKNISVNIEDGSFKAGGDLNSAVRLKINKGNIDMARFKGSIDAEVSKGNIIIGSGRLTGQSKILCKDGNINVKTEIIKPDSYCFSTEVGNIELKFPSKTAGDFMCQGNVLSNAFTSSSNGSKIVVSNYQGAIAIKKY